MRVLVTGATGFVGGAACRRLLADGHQVVAAVRRDAPLPLDVETRKVGPLGADTDWRAALDGVDAVLHLAARAHVMNDTEKDPLEVFRRINRDGTLTLALQAASAGVKHFTFVSTIKVNGEATPPDRPFRADDRPDPRDAYGLAKAEAEVGLAELADSTGLPVAIVRPPMVHGPGAKGNLAALMRVLRHGVPLPLACIHNRRSLVGVENLADALAFVVNRRATGTFLVRDGEDVATPELVRAIADGMGVRARLLPVPTILLTAAATLAGKGAAARRLTGSLVVDDSPLRGLGWAPPVSLRAGLAAMAAAARTGEK